MFSENCEKRLLISSCLPACLPACLSVRPCVCPHEMIRLRLDGFSWILIFEYFSKMRRENSSFFLNLTRITGTVHEDLSTFMVISRLIHLRMRNVSGKCCKENQNTHLMFNNYCSESPAVFDILVSNVKACGSQTGHRLMICDMAHVHCVLDNEDYRYSAY